MVIPRDRSRFYFGACAPLWPTLVRSDFVTFTNSQTAYRAA